MTDPHSNALFLSPEEGVHDGCYLITKPRCPVKFAQYQARIAALPEVPSDDFRIKTALMGMVHEVESDDEWRKMMEGIWEVEKRIRVIDGGKGGDASG